MRSAACEFPRSTHSVPAMQEFVSGNERISIGLSPLRQSSAIAGTGNSANSFASGDSRGTSSHDPGEFRAVGAEQSLADAGMHAIGADQHVAAHGTGFNLFQLIGSSRVRT